MSWQSDLVARLNGAVPMAGGWSWFERARQEGLPGGVLTLIDPGAIYSHDGAAAVNFAAVQFDIYGREPTVIVALIGALRSEMELDESGDGGGIVTGETRFHPAFLRSQRTVPPDDLGDGTRIFGMQQDYNFHHEPNI